MGSDIIKYKYDVDAKPSLYFSDLAVFLTVTAFVIIAFCIFTYSPPLGLAFFTISFFIWIALKGGNEAIILHNEFMIIGNKVIYFSCIERAILDHQNKRLDFVLKDEAEFTIYASNFKTNARKDHKVKKNKSQKFLKIADKIIQKIKVKNSITFRVLLVNQ